MNRLLTLFAGFLTTFALSWMGLVIIPYYQIGLLTPQLNEEDGKLYPPEPSGLATQGARVYAANGCVYCHSQQVRGGIASGSDIARGWGARRTVARDYIYEKPAFLGTMRTGPDLTNIGARQRGEEGRKWHHLHLYAPAEMSEGSIMPPYRYLYVKRKIQGEPSPDRLIFPEGKGPELAEDEEIVPTYEARALVEYLLSLNRNYPLKEAPVDLE